MLADLARLMDIHPAPWLPQAPVTPTMLGVPVTVRACLFDLDGVLTDSGVLHALAWAEAFDPFLLQVLRASRLAVHSLRPGGLRRLSRRPPAARRCPRIPRKPRAPPPEGRPDDPAGAETAYGLARRKSEALTRGLSRSGVNALGGARRYLEACGFAGLGRGVVSASTRTLPMLELAGLATLVEERVDAESIRTRAALAAAPDLLLAACARLGVGRTRRHVHPQPRRSRRRARGGPRRDRGRHAAEQASSCAARRAAGSFSR